MSLDRKQRFWLVILVVLLAIPLALLLARFSGGFVRDVITAPFVYLAWIGRLYLRTVPPALFWGALLVFGFALAAINILVAVGGVGRRETGYQEGSALDQPYSSPVERLTSQIHYAGRSAYFTRRLAQRLGEVILRSLDYEEPYGRTQIERALETLDAPPDIRAFLCEGEALISRSRRVGLLAWLKRRLQGRETSRAPIAKLERVVRFLEERLEVL